MTIFQRSKESEEDYGYIFDTDLPMIELSDDYLKELKSSIPELPHEKVERYVKNFKIDKKYAEILAAEHVLADLFEKVAKEINPELAARWLRHELLRVVNYNKKELDDLEIDEKHVIQLLKLVENKKITDNNAQKILEKMIEKSFDLAGIVKEAIKESSNAVRDYKAGKQESFNFIIGMIMKKTKGQARPDAVRKILKEEIEKA